MYQNLIKEKLASGEITIGAWAQIASSLTTEILGEAGYDWLMIDLEHGPGDIMILVQQIQSLKGTGCVPLVRAPWNDFVQIKRILDAGAFGILVPYINTAAEAELAVQACRYPPDGIRGVSGSPRAAGFGQNKGEYLQRANQEILTLAAVETPQAADNLDGILQVNGLDGIFIGPMDLAASMGQFGNPSHPEVQEQIGKIESRVKAAGKVLATTTGSQEQARALALRGYQMLMVMADGVSLARAAKQNVINFRKELE